MENTSQIEPHVGKKDETQERFTERYFRRSVAGGWKVFPLSRISKIYLKKEAVLEFANQCVEVVSVLVELEKGDPIRILGMSTNTWAFDSDGVIDSQIEFAKILKNIDNPRKTQFKLDSVENIAAEDVNAICHLLGLK
jgi:hypothetical protein